MFITRALSFLMGTESLFQAYKRHCQEDPKASYCPENLQKAEHLPEFLKLTALDLASDFRTRAQKIQTALIEESLKAQIKKGDPKINLPGLSVDFLKCNATKAINDYLRQRGSAYRVVLALPGAKLKGVIGVISDETPAQAGTQTVEEFVFTKNTLFLMDGDPEEYLAFNNSIESIAYFPEHIQKNLEERRRWTSQSPGLVHSPLALTQGLNLRAKHFQALQDLYQLYKLSSTDAIPQEMVTDALGLVKIHERGHFLIDQTWSPLYRLYMSYFDHGVVFLTYLETLADTYVMDEIARTYDQNPKKGEKLNLVWIACRRSADTQRGGAKARSLIASEFILRDLLGVYLGGETSNQKSQFLHELAADFRAQFGEKLHTAAISAMITLASKVKEFSHLPKSINDLPESETDLEHQLQEVLRLLHETSQIPKLGTCGDSHSVLKVGISLFGAIFDRHSDLKAQVEGMLQGMETRLLERLP